MDRKLIRAKIGEATPSNMLAVKCQRCAATMGEVSDNSIGQLHVKCKRCGHMNRFAMPNVDPRGLSGSIAQSPR